jgi:hypothetical protein
VKTVWQMLKNKGQEEFEKKTLMVGLLLVDVIIEKSC